MGGEEEKKKPEEEKPSPPAEKPAGDGESKKDEAEKKKDDAGEAKEAGKEETPPAPAPEIVLRVFMHCEGCARKVKKSLRGFAGVEDVTTDCKNQKVVVKGEKADPVKVLERVQRKSHRHVELLSPIPKPPSEEEGAKKPEEKEPPKQEEKKEEAKVITVVLKVHMHCEACAQEIKKRIEKMKGVEVATPDLKNSEVTVKGTFDPPKLVDYIYRRTGKQAVVVKQEPEEPKEEGEKGKEGGNKEEKKGKNGDEKKGGDGGDEKKEGGGEKAEGGGGETAAAAEEEMKVVELHRNEFYHCPPKYGVPMYQYAYPPQIFSDENPNACEIM